jgi:hypothetical protein
MIIIPNYAYMKIFELSEPAMQKDMRRNEGYRMGIKERKKRRNCFDDLGYIPGRGKRFSLFHSIQTASGAHPVSYPVGTGDSFPRGKMVGASN